MSFASKTPAEKAEYHRAWRSNNPGKASAIKKRYRANHPDASRMEYLSNIETIQERHRKYWQSLDAKLTMYTRNAARRGILFSLSKDEFSSFWQKPCTYCGLPIETIGLDRVDNSVGYVAGNVAPCCKPCNYAKAGMTTAQFVAMCKRVAARNP